VICVFGDAHIDVVVQMSGPPIAETDTPAITELSVGGQGANVAAWVSALGGRSRLIAARGTDPAARFVATELASRGVDLVGPTVAGRTGVVVCLSDGGRQRSMLTDRGVGTRLPADQVSAEWLDGCDWLHVSGYSLAEDPVTEAAVAMAQIARARSAAVSVDLSSTAVIRSRGVARFVGLLDELGPDVVFGNQAEAELVGPLRVGTLIVKLGAQGVRVGGTLHPAKPTVPLDATGAGDAFAAGYLVGGVELGLTAAARAVAKMGAMP
jgi:ribokinase